MCGIVYAQSFLGTPVNNTVMQQFDQQRSRGTEGFGLFNGKHLVHAAKEDRILNWLVKDKNESDLIMFHHRRPTSTINVRRAAHPFSTKDYFGKNQYILVHNGYIGNDHELRDEHVKLGITYQSDLDDGTFNDSEALLWDFALYAEGKQKELKAYGGIAFTCMKLVDGKLEKLYFARNTNPLNMARDRTGLMLSSEGEGDEIKRDTLHTWHYSSQRLTKKELEVPSYKAYNYHDDYDWKSGSSYDSSGVFGYHRKDTPALPWGSRWNDDEEYRSYPSSYDNYLDCELCEDLGTLDGCYDCGLFRDIPNRTLRESFIQKIDPIGAGEIETEAMRYLMKAKGRFFDALWMLDSDYDKTYDNPTTRENIRQQLLIEKVSDVLAESEEYENQESVSSVWRAVWQQTQLS